MEYDVDIKSTKLVKGRGLAKLLVESNCQVLDLHLMAENPQQDVVTEHNKEQIYSKYRDSPWYEKIVYFLLHLQCPRDLNKNECRSLKLKSLKYVLIDQVLYWKDRGGILLKCLDKSEVGAITAELHSGVCGGHNIGKQLHLKY